MSDFEDDIGEQLLELAGATEKKKKRRQHSGGSGSSSGRKRKADRMDMGSDSEPEAESEEEDPYPLEGKYKDEADKRELLSMTELKREQILEERAAHKQRIQSARALAEMVRQQQKGSFADDAVARASKRQHTARGATKEKARSLDVLKAKRKAKDDIKRTKAQSPSRDRSNSPQDMDISDSESEDGQITKMEQEDERMMTLTGGYDKKKKDNKEEPDVPCTLQDLNACRLTRDQLAKHCHKPWFQEFVTGSWVRYLIGAETNGQPVYRACEVANLAADFVKPYKIDDKTVIQAFELKHGKSVRVFNMDKVSNSAFTDREFDRLVKTCNTEDVKMPTKRSLETKWALMRKLVEQPMTEADISAMLAIKSQAQAGTKATVMTTLDRSRLNQERTLALRRGDYKEAAEIEEKLKAAEATQTPTTSNKSESADTLARVNERNRKANNETVRRVELEAAEKKRQDRKLAMQNGGVGPPADPSARLRIMPRMFTAQTPKSSRPTTPAIAPEPEQSTTASTSAPLTTTGGLGKGAKSFEARILESIEIDLGDF